MADRPADDAELAGHTVAGGEMGVEVRGEDQEGHHPDGGHVARGSGPCVEGARP